MAVETPRRGQSTFARLQREVMAQANNPEDALHVAALLESLGWTDEAVERELGYPTVFDCAEDLYREIRSAVAAHPLPTVTVVPPMTLLAQVLRELVHGVTFTWPMLVSIAAMITLHLSFSGYARFPLTTATAIALGTFFSFLATGGFSQAMTYLYYVLVGLQKEDEAATMVSRAVALGVGTAGALAVLLVVLDALFPILPLGAVLIMVLYMLLLGGMWLTFAGLYILRRAELLALTTALAIAATYVLFTHGWPMIAAQSVGMGSAALATMGLFVALVRRSLRRRPPQGVRAVATRLPQLVHGALPYFLYGLLYFVFIYFDRLVAWSTGTTYLPFTVWFRGTYELPMDWALIALIVPLSVTEVFLGHLQRVLTRGAERLQESKRQGFAGLVRKSYLFLLGAELLLALGGLLAARALIAALAHLPLFAPTIPDHGHEGFVLLLASIAYGLLSVALANILLLFTWSLPQPALRTLLFGLLVDATVGILATRVTGLYWEAVLGLLAGSAVTALFSTRQVLATLPTLDYVLYRLT